MQIQIYKYKIQINMWWHKRKRYFTNKALYFYEMNVGHAHIAQLEWVERKAWLQVVVCNALILESAEWTSFWAMFAELQSLNHTVLTVPLSIPFYWADISHFWESFRPPLQCLSCLSTRTNWPTFFPFPSPRNRHPWEFLRTCFSGGKNAPRFPTFDLELGHVQVH